MDTKGSLHNSLNQKIIDTIVEILSKIFTSIGPHHNMDIIGNSLPHSSMYNLWVSVFTTGELWKGDLEEEESAQVPVTEAYTEIKCQFPFSWIIKEVVDTLLKQAMHVTGMDIH